MNEKEMKNFALIGVAGYVAPRHLAAIKETGNKLVAALDPSDSVGIMDSFFPDADFFTEPERFDRHLDKLRRKGAAKIDYVSICSPNYLHDAHIRMALRNEAHAICEKPLVLNPWNLEALAEIERETGKNIYTILQLRFHPVIQALKARVEQEPDRFYQLSLQYITPRGKWYFRSWKGNEAKSGGIATNIGVHFFDMLVWIFGEPLGLEVIQNTGSQAGGKLRFARAEVHWFMSIDAADLPVEVASQGLNSFRELRIDGEEIDFSSGFTQLHTVNYQAILEGKGHRISEAGKAIELVHQIRQIKS